MFFLSLFGCLWYNTTIYVYVEDSRYDFFKNPVCCIALFADAPAGIPFSYETGRGSAGECGEICKCQI